MKKTLRSRVAAVAVAALGAGLLQAAPAFADTALTVAANATDGAYSATFASAKSTGVLATDTTVATQSTATLLSAGTLVVKASANNSANQITITGGRIVATGKQTSGDTLTVNTALTTASITAAASNNGFAVAIQPNGVGTLTVALYEGGTLAAPTDGTLRGYFTVNVVASSAAGIYAAPYSFVKADDATTDASTITTSVDAETTIANGSAGFIAVRLRDAYGSNLSSAGTGVLTATATNGAIVRWGGTPSIGAYTSTAVNTDGVEELQVKQGTLNAPVNTTVTISWNGTEVAKKSFTIHGAATQISIYSVKVAPLGAYTYATDGTDAIARFKVLDAAGNWVNFTGAIAVDSTTLNKVVTAVNLPDSGTHSVSTYTTSGLRWPQPRYNDISLVGRSGTFSWTCSALYGDGQATPKLYLINELNQVVSATFTAKCSDGPVTMDAAFDKASYKTGDIATLTLTFKNSEGNLINDVEQLDVAVTSGGLSAAAVPAIAATDKATNGVKTYKFIVTGDAGKTYQVVVTSGLLDGYLLKSSPVTVPLVIAAAAADPTVKALTDAVASMMTSIQLLMTSLSASIATLIKALAKKK